MGKNEYRNEVFWPISVSQQAPESIFCSILKVAISKEKESSMKFREFDEKFDKGALKLLEKLKDDVAVKEWIYSNFTFKTKKNRRLFPLHVSAAFTANEPYDNLFEKLMRAGRSEGNETKVLSQFIEYFRESINVDDINTKLYLDLSLNEFLNCTGLPKALNRSKFSQSILCQPQARLFQNDISGILSKKIPRKELLELIFSIVSFHFSSYLARMSLSASYHENDIRKFSRGGFKQKISPHYCYTCRKKFKQGCGEDDESELNEYFNNCPFNQIFLIGNESYSNQLISSIKQFVKRMVLFNTIEDVMFNKKLSNYEILKDDYYRSLEGKGDKIDEIERSLRKSVSWEHPIGFFNALVNKSDYGINNNKTARGGNYNFYISNSLLKAFVAICCHRNKTIEVFIDKFLEFLSRRGIDFTSNEKENLISQLKKLDLLTITEDAGAARCIVAPYK